MEINAKRIQLDVPVYVLGTGAYPNWFNQAVNDNKIQVFEHKDCMRYRIAIKGGGFYVGHDGDYLVNDPISGIKPLTKTEFEKEYERC